MAALLAEAPGSSGACEQATPRELRLTEGIQEEMVVAMLNGLQSAAAACAEIALQRLHSMRIEVRREMMLERQKMAAELRAEVAAGAADGRQQPGCESFNLDESGEQDKSLEGMYEDSKVWGTESSPLRLPTEEELSTDTGTSSFVCQSVASLPSESVDTFDLSPQQSPVAAQALPCVEDSIEPGVAASSEDAVLRPAEADEAQESMPSLPEASGSQEGTEHAAPVIDAVAGAEMKLAETTAVQIDVAVAQSTEAAAQSELAAEMTTTTAAVAEGVVAKSPTAEPVENPPTTEAPATAAAPSEASTEAPVTAAVVSTESIVEGHTTKECEEQEGQTTKENEEQEPHKLSTAEATTETPAEGSAPKPQSPESVKEDATVVKEDSSPTQAATPGTCTEVKVPEPQAETSAKEEAAKAGDHVHEERNDPEGRAPMTETAAGKEQVESAAAGTAAVSELAAEETAIEATAATSEAKVLPIVGEIVAGDESVVTQEKEVAATESESKIEIAASDVAKDQPSLAETVGEEDSSTTSTKPPTPQDASKAVDDFFADFDTGEETPAAQVVTEKKTEEEPGTSQTGFRDFDADFEDMFKDSKPFPEVGSPPKEASSDSKAPANDSAAAALSPEACVTPSEAPATDWAAFPATTPAAEAATKRPAEATASDWAAFPATNAGVEATASPTSSDETAQLSVTLRPEDLKAAAGSPMGPGEAAEGGVAVSLLSKPEAAGQDLDWCNKAEENLQFDSPEKDEEDSLESERKALQLLLEENLFNGEESSAPTEVKLSAVTLPTLDLSNCSTSDSEQKSQTSDPAAGFTPRGNHETLSLSVLYLTGSKQAAPDGLARVIQKTVPEKKAES